jgi:major membrane immunogen (membrane-anchored lipoprotein)
MKKIKLAVVLLMTGTMSLTSCSSDDSKESASIVGKWTPVKTVVKTGTGTLNQKYEDNQPGCDKDYVEFVDGGVFRKVIWFKNAENVCTEDAAEPQVWSKDDKELTIMGGAYNGTYDISKLSGSELRIVSTQSIGGTSATTTVYFSKVK